MIFLLFYLEHIAPRICIINGPEEGPKRPQLDY